MMLLYMYQIFSSLRSHLHFFVNFFFTFMEYFFLWTPYMYMFICVLDKICEDSVTKAINKWTDKAFSDDYTIILLYFCIIEC